MSSVRIRISHRIPKIKLRVQFWQLLGTVWYLSKQGSLNFGRFWELYETFTGRHKFFGSIEKKLHQKNKQFQRYLISFTADKDAQSNKKMKKGCKKMKQNTSNEMMQNRCMTVAKKMMRNGCNKWSKIDATIYAKNRCKKDGGEKLHWICRRESKSGKVLIFR